MRSTLIDNQVLLLERQKYKTHQCVSRQNMKITKRTHFHYFSESSGAASIASYFSSTTRNSSILDE